MEFAIGGMAAASAGVFTNPIEVLKHHMELNKKTQVHADKYKSFLHAGYSVAKKEGVKSLQKGLSPALCSHLVSYGMKLGTYQFASNRGFTKNSSGEVVVPKSIAMSGVGGMLGQYLSSPFYLVKAQKEIEIQASANKGDNHEGYMNTVKNIYKEHGMRGFFRGATASLPRAFIGTSQLTSFAVAKEQLSKLDSFKGFPMFTTFVASSIAGLVLSICMTPFDMVLTKLYKQAITGTQLYEGFVDCVKKTYRSSGAKPFYNGLGPIYMKLGPHAVLCLVFWESFKDIYDGCHDTSDVENSFYSKNFAAEQYNADTSCDFYWT